MQTTRVQNAAFNRRRLLGLGATLAGASVAPAFLTQRAHAAPRGPNLDATILNFALNLEYLEAEFYLRAAFGRSLEDFGVDVGRGAGAVTGGRAVSFTTPAIRQYAEEIARDEAAHVIFIRGALGAAAVARPAIDLKNSFTAAAQAAGLIGPGQTFDPFGDETSFLLGAYLFEDVGVTAYKGAAPLITDPDILSAAAGILAVEAYHAANIRTTIFAAGATAQSAANAISDARDSLDGSTDLDQGVLVSGRGNIVPSDLNGLAYSRVPTQVLKIVYLNAAGTPGGFFPAGVNGDFSALP